MLHCVFGFTFLPFSFCRMFGTVFQLICPCNCLFVRPFIGLLPACLVCHMRFFVVVSRALCSYPPCLPDPLCPVPRRPRQLEPRAPRLFASAPPMLPDPPPPPHIPCVCPPCVGGTCKFLKIMCVVKRALLYSPPAETRLTVYRRLDIAAEQRSCMQSMPESNTGETRIARTDHRN